MYSLLTLVLFIHPADEYKVAFWYFHFIKDKTKRNRQLSSFLDQLSNFFYRVDSNLGFVGHLVLTTQLAIVAWKQPQIIHKQIDAALFKYNFIYKNRQLAGFGCSAPTPSLDCNSTLNNAERRMAREEKNS